MCQNMSNKKTKHLFTKKQIDLSRKRKEKYAELLKSVYISNTKPQKVIEFMTEYFGFSICRLKPQHFLKGFVPIQKTSEQGHSWEISYKLAVWIFSL